MPRITVDGKILDVTEGRTLLQALDDTGLLMNEVEIPHYCWHPKLSIDGSCRLCQVEVEGMDKLQIACNTPVEEGMVVRTRTDRVRRAREGVMELLLVNHPLDCPICDQAGECKLQDYAYDYGVAASRTREPRRAAKKNVEIGPTIVFDQERCILCRRCVRFCHEVTGTSELAVVNRGDESVIETFPGEDLDNDYSMNVADLCPVGALTTRDFRFKVRVWFLEDVPGVCTGCARGCNVDIGTAKGRIHRYVPRRNDAVNQTWLCDAGRLSYKRIGASDRLREAFVRAEDGSVASVGSDVAIAAAAERLSRLVDAKGAGVVAGVASCHATNEDLFTLRRFLAALGTPFMGVAVIRGEADELLVVAEKGANAAGARALGFADAGPIAERIRSGGVDGLVVLGHDLLHEQYLGGDAALAGLDTVIALDTHASALQRRAHVLLPSRVPAEKHGTLTNCNGRVQRVRPAVEPAWEAAAEGEILARLGAAMGLPGFGGHWEPREVSLALSQEIAAFAGRNLDALDDGGAFLVDVETT